MVMIDGIHFPERVVLVALGFDARGRKHVLGMREGSTEKTQVVRALLADLIERGLDADAPRLWVIDGGKALRRAITETFGDTALVHRCQEHKRVMFSIICPRSCTPASGAPCARPGKAMTPSRPSANSNAWRARSASIILAPRPACVRARRDTDIHQLGRRTARSTGAQDHQPDRELERAHRALHAQRQALARR